MSNSHFLLGGLAAGGLLGGAVATAVYFHRAPIRALRSPYWIVRANAIVDVAERGCRDALPLLRGFLNERQATPVIAWNARWAIHRLTEGAPAADTGVPAGLPVLKPELKAELSQADPAADIWQVQAHYALPAGGAYAILDRSDSGFMARRYGVPREREVAAKIGPQPPFLRAAVYRRDPSGAWVHHFEAWYRLDALDGPFEEKVDLVCPKALGPYRVVLETPELLLAVRSRGESNQPDHVVREATAELDLPPGR